MLETEGVKGDNNGRSNNLLLLDPASYLDGYLSVTHCVSAFIGIPLNLAIAAAILWTRRLRNARNFTWLGIGFSSIFLLVSHIFEVLVAKWPNTFTHVLCTWLTDLPYQSLLISLFVSLAERHLCLKRPGWHRRWVARNCWAIPVVQVGLSSLICLLAQTRHFLIEAFPVEWQLSLLDLKILTSFVLAGYFLCLAQHAALWATSNRKYPHAQILAVRPGAHRTAKSCPEEGGDEIVQAVEEADGPFVLVHGERVSQLDVKSARTMTLCGFMILTSFIPCLIGTAYLVGCLTDDVDEGNFSGTDCDYLAQITYYQREFVSVPCFLLIPLYFVSTSKDLKSVLRDRSQLLFRTKTSTTSSTLTSSVELSSR